MQYGSRILVLAILFQSVGCNLLNGRATEEAIQYNRPSGAVSKALEAQIGGRPAPIVASSTARLTAEGMTVEQLKAEREEQNELRRQRDLRFAEVQREVAERLRQQQEELLAAAKQPVQHVQPSYVTLASANTSTFSNQRIPQGNTSELRPLDKAAQALLAVKHERHTQNDAVATPEESSTESQATSKPWWLITIVALTLGTILTWPFARNRKGDCTSLECNSTEDSTSDNLPSLVSQLDEKGLQPGATQGQVEFTADEAEKPPFVAEDRPTWSSNLESPVAEYSVNCVATWDEAVWHEAFSETSFQLPIIAIESDNIAIHVECDYASIQKHTETQTICRANSKSLNDLSLNECQSDCLDSMPTEVAQSGACESDVISPDIIASGKTKTDSIASDRIESEIIAIANTESANTDSANTDSANTDSANTDSANTESENTESENSEITRAAIAKPTLTLLEINLTNKTDSDVNRLEVQEQAAEANITAIENTQMDFICATEQLEPACSSVHFGPTQDDLVWCELSGANAQHTEPHVAIVLVEGYDLADFEPSGSEVKLEDECFSLNDEDAENDAANEAESTNKTDSRSICLIRLPAPRLKARKSDDKQCCGLVELRRPGIAHHLSVESADQPAQVHCNTQGCNQRTVTSIKTLPQRTLALLKLSYRPKISASRHLVIVRKGSATKTANQSPVSTTGLILHSAMAQETAHPNRKHNLPALLRRPAKGFIVLYDSDDLRCDAKQVMLVESYELQNSGQLRAKVRSLGK